jgi:2',3'-cyclic-nucleotide 2'-phosphodiesterase (5'-nucleotidase family)
MTREDDVKRALEAPSVPPIQGFDFHVFVQLNDVYFLDARADYSKPDGLLLPRIATMVRRLRQHLPGRVTVCVPGDFLAPSCLGKLTTGEHMVDVFNGIGVDLVTFGNHEFELPPFTPATLARNIAASDFTWLCANFKFDSVELADLFSRRDKIKKYQLVRLRDGLVAVLFGLTLPAEYRAYGKASTPIDAARDVIEEVRHTEPSIRDGTDEPIFIAMTHQDAKDDLEFAKQCPELLLVMGGHDHDEDYVIDQYRPMIVKAASNARTIRFNVLLHRRNAGMGSAKLKTDLESLWLDSRSKVLNRVFDTLTHAAAAAAPESVRRLMTPPERPAQASRHSDDAFIDDTRLRSGIVQFGDFGVGLYSFAIDTTAPAVRDHIPERPETAARIAYWENCWDRRSGGTRDPILVLPLDFNARDGEVRKRSTNIGNLAADALCQDADGNQVAPIGLLNSGSLRIDRKLSGGETVSQRTLCDLLFFTNTVQVYRLSGRELWQLLEKSFELRSAGGAEGHGDFLQISGIRVLWKDDKLARVIATDHLTFEDELPRDGTQYQVATTDYVATISKHYRQVFEKKDADDIAVYSRHFEAAVRRLGSIADIDGARRYFPIVNDRWLPEKSYRNLLLRSARPR